MPQAPMPQSPPSLTPLPRDRSESLRVTVEATDDAPRGWAWAIDLDAGQTLIARSRSLYRSERDAREAGHGAAAAVRRNLQRQAVRASLGRAGATFWKA